MTGHGRGIAQDDKLHPGAGDGHIHTAQVAQESDLSLVVGPHKGDEDDVAFLPLEPVDGVHADEVTVRLEELAFLEEAAQVLHLGAVGGDDTHIEPFLEDALLADFLEVLFEGEEGEFGLGLIDATEGFTDKFLVEEGEF